MTERTLKFTAKVNFFRVGVSHDEIVSHGSCPEELKHGGMKLWQKAATAPSSRLKSPEARRPVCMLNSRISMAICIKNRFFYTCCV